MSEDDESQSRHRPVYSTDAEQASLWKKSCEIRKDAENKIRRNVTVKVEGCIPSTNAGRKDCSLGYS